MMAKQAIVWLLAPITFGLAPEGESPCRTVTSRARGRGAERLHGVWLLTSSLLNGLQIDAAQPLIRGVPGFDKLRQARRCGAAPERLAVRRC